MSITVQNKLKKLALPRSEKQVAVAMAGHLWEKNPDKGTWVGAETTAAECGLAERTVRLALSGLRSKQIIKLAGHKKGARGNKPIYTFHPENGKLLPHFADDKPAMVAGSKTDKPANSADKPANDAINLQMTVYKPAMVAPKQVRARYEQERESTASDPSSYFVWLLSAYSGLNLTDKEKRAVQSVVSSGTYDLSVLKQASARVLDPLDVLNTFDRAGDKLATNLETQCEAVLLDRKKARERDEQVRACTEQEQDHARQEAAALLAASAEESALIEDRL